MSATEGDSLTLADVEALVRGNVTGHVDGDRHEQGKQRLLTALRQSKSSVVRRKGRILTLMAAVAVLSAGGAYVWKQRSSARLTYGVEGSIVSDSGYVRGIDSRGARLSFSDGTQVELQDGSRARIAAVDAHGARIAIENGHAALSVAGVARSAWYLDAGPFVIHASGTRFDIDWSSYDDTLSVDLHQGSLTVSGPPAPSGVLLREGQRLTAHEGRLSIEALEPVGQRVPPPHVFDAAMLDAPFVSPDAPATPTTAEVVSPPPPGEPHLAVPAPSP